MTIASDNVDRFIERREDAARLVNHERHVTIGNTMTALVDPAQGPGAAFYELYRGVRRQWLLTGVGELQLGPEPKPSEVIAAWDRAPKPRPLAYEVYTWPHTTRAPR